MSTIDNLARIKPITPKIGRDHLFRASSLGKCPRIQLLESFGLRVKIPEDRKWTLKLGTIIHKAIQESIKNEFDNVELELKVNNPELQLGGTVDAVIIE